MSLSHPDARIGLGTRSFSLAEAAVARLRVLLARGPGHDRCELVAWPDSRLADLAAGDPLEVSLGERGDEEDVWAGEVTRVRHTPRGLAVEGLALTARLSRAYRSETFIRSTVADVVRALAGDVPTDSVEGDVTLEAYAVDDRRSAWSHILELGELAGADVTSGPGGGLRFVPPREGAPAARLRHGADVLDWDLWAVQPEERPASVPLGAGSEEGAERWHWLRRSGGGDGRRVLRAAFRTRDPADALEERQGAARERSRTRGRLLAVGRPKVRPGDLVELVDLPAGAPSRVRVLGVLHGLDARAGFVTRLDVEGGGS